MVEGKETAAGGINNENKPTNYSSFDNEYE